MKRIIEIDSIRGLAALSVLIGHFLIFKGLEIEPYNFMYWFTYSPLHIISAGHEAVVLFFILSGLVLCLAYKQGEKFNIFHFLIKRLSRIYIPVFVMLIVTIFLKYMFYDGNGLSGVSEWINGKWSDPIDIKMLLKHFTLIFEYSYKDGLNPVLWSLTHELRFYIIFPLIIYVLMKLNIFLFSFIVGLSMFSGYEGLIIKLGFSFSIPYGIHVTLIYLPAFLSGIFLGKYIENIRDFYIHHMSVHLKVSLLIVALLLYTYKWTFHAISEIHNAYSDYSAIILGSCIFIVSGISSKRIATFLSHPILVFFGNISFSLYLYHLVILLTSLYIFNNLIPVWSILLIALLVTVTVSFLSFKYVETPSINYVKKLINSKDKSICIYS